MYSFISEAFLLGISTGVYCFSQCGIVFIPYIFSENGSGMKSRTRIVLQFLSGRFIAYTGIGFLSGLLGQHLSVLFTNYEPVFRIVFASSYLILSILLIINAIFTTVNHTTCRLKIAKSNSRFPILLGLFTGLNICPPFIAAVARAFDSGSIFTGGAFFVVFFIATSLFILPLIFSGLLKRKDAVNNIARICSVLAGIFLAIKGAGYLL